MENLAKKIEGILFLHGEPLHIKRLVKATGEKEKDVKEALINLQKDYESRGLRLIEHAEEWQLATSSEISDIIKEFTKSEYTENLSRAALETLAVVAYKGPLTRAEVEFIRGVNSVYSLRNLLMRGLIEKKDNPVDGRSHIYTVTFDFIRHFGMEKISDLPRYGEFHNAEVPKQPEE